MALVNRCYIFFLPLILTLLLAACAGQEAAPAGITAAPTPIPTTPLTGRGAGGTLRLLYWEAPTILNPHLTTGIKDWEASRVTYEPLASFDKKAQLVPVLAAEIPSLENGDLAQDYTSVIWKLKPDVKWSDGQPFTAADVRFTYEFITNPEVGSTSAINYQAVAGVEVVDDYTVKVNFKTPNPAWTLPFVGVYGMILPEHIFKDYNNANVRQAPANSQPVGTGPYRVLSPGIKPQEVLFLGTQLIQTNKITFEPNPYFREPDKPYFSRVELRGGGTVNEAARQVLQDGLVDFSYNLSLPPEDLNRLEAAGAGVVVANFGSTVEMFELNRSDPNRETPDGERSNKDFPHPFLSDLKVRQAFAYAIDREAIVKLYGKAGQLTSNILVAPEQYASPNTSAEFNLDKARQLLDEAGWTDSDGDGIRDKNGRPMKVVYRTSENAIRQATQNIIKAGLEAIGVDVELSIIDAATYLGGDPNSPLTVEHFYADVQEYDISSSAPDPLLYTGYWTCAQIPQKANNWLAGLNTTRQCNPEYDALQQQAAQELDPEKRKQLFIQMNDLLINDVVMVPLARVARLSGVSRNIEGVDLTPWDSALWNIKDWRGKTNQ